MFRDLLNNPVTRMLAEWATVIFFIVFLAILIRTLLRPRRQIRDWANIPLTDEPVEPRREDSAP